MDMIKIVRFAAFAAVSATLASCGMEAKTAQWETYVVRQKGGAIVSSQKAREALGKDPALVAAFERSVRSASTLLDPSKHGALVGDPRYDGFEAYFARLAEKAADDAKLCDAVNAGKTRLEGTEKGYVVQACADAKKTVARRVAEAERDFATFCTATGILQSSWMRGVAEEVRGSGPSGVTLTPQRYADLRDRFIHDAIDAEEPDPLLRSMKTSCVMKFDAGTGGVPLYYLILASMFRQAATFSDPSAPSDRPAVVAPETPSEASGAAPSETEPASDGVLDGMFADLFNSPENPNGSGARAPESENPSSQSSGGLAADSSVAVSPSLTGAASLVVGDDVPSGSGAATGNNDDTSFLVDSFNAFFGPGEPDSETHGDPAPKGAQDAAAVRIAESLRESPLFASGSPVAAAAEDFGNSVKDPYAAQAAQAEKDRASGKIGASAYDGTQAKIAEKVRGDAAGLIAPVAAREAALSPVRSGSVLPDVSPSARARAFVGTLKASLRPAGEEPVGAAFSAKPVALAGGDEGREGARDVSRPATSSVPRSLAWPVLALSLSLAGAFWSWVAHRRLRGRPAA